MPPESAFTYGLIKPVGQRYIARRELALESALAKLDKYHLLILDDIVYVSKDQPETSVLFELIGTRYERRSMLITANQPFGECPSLNHLRDERRELSTPCRT